VSIELQWEPYEGPQGREAYEAITGEHRYTIERQHPSEVERGLKPYRLGFYFLDKGEWQGLAADTKYYKTVGHAKRGAVLNETAYQEYAAWREKADAGKRHMIGASK
jgi:hypothetical protein